MLKRLSIILFTLFSCQSGDLNDLILLEGEAQGTTYHIKFYGNPHVEYQLGVDSIFSLMDMAFSTYVENSLVSQFNRSDSGIEVSETFLELIHYSTHVNGFTSGAFDPTVGPLVQAYGFGPSGKGKIPDSLELAKLMQMVGMNNIVLENDKFLRKLNAGVQLDFNAIAQGYTVDRIARFLENKAIENYMVEVGGELIVKGRKPSAEPWTIGIDKPVESENGRELQLMVELQNMAMATSGNYRKFYVDGDRKVTHTINPVTGQTVSSTLLSATVIAVSCVDADAFATAFMVMGKEKAIELLNISKDLEAILIYSDNKGKLKTFITPGARKWVVAAN